MWGFESVQAAFCTVLSWKTRPGQGQRPGPQRLQVCTLWTRRKFLGLPGAAAVQQSGAEGPDQNTRTPSSSQWKPELPSVKKNLAIIYNAGHFLAAASLQYNLVWDRAHIGVRDVEDFHETLCLKKHGVLIRSCARKARRAGRACMCIWTMPLEDAMCGCLSRVCVLLLVWCKQRAALCWKEVAMAVHSASAGPFSQWHCNMHSWKQTQVQTSDTVTRCCGNSVWQLHISLHNGSEVMWSQGHIHAWGDTRYHSPPTFPAISPYWIQHWNVHSCCPKCVGHSHAIRPCVWRSRTLKSANASKGPWRKSELIQCAAAWNNVGLSSNGLPLSGVYRLQISVFQPGTRSFKEAWQQDSGQKLTTQRRQCGETMKPTPAEQPSLRCDVFFRKLCRSIVTPPSDTDWSLEWHEILHHWNDRARTFAQTAGLQPWSYCVCRQHWKLASHIVIPEHRWVRRILAWNPSVRYRSLGRRPHTWDYQIQAFCRYRGLGPWLEEAKCHHHWTAFFEDFYAFCQMWGIFEIACETNVHIFSPPVPKMGSPCGVQALTICDVVFRNVLVRSENKALHQTSSPLLGRPAWTWPSPLHIREPPVSKWLASCPMLGDWPVKQSLLLNILRSKRRVKKNNKAPQCDCDTHGFEVLPTGYP